MRKSAEVTGSDIVEKLVEGSATFETKTGFSKAKYIRKKMQKHVFTVRVLQPTAFNMAQVYYAKHLPRVHRLRFDSLARLLTSSNVSSNARVLCVDGCGGLVAGAILEKLAPTSSALPHIDVPAADAAQVSHPCVAANKSPRGGLVIAYPDQRAAIDAVRWMNHSPSLLQHVSSCPLYYALAALEGKSVFFPGARVSAEAKACEEKGESCEVDIEGRGEDDAVEKQIDEEQALEEIGEHVVADADDQVGGQAEESQQQKQHKHEPRAKRTELSSRSIKRATVESVKQVAGPHGFDCVVIAGCISNITEVITRIIPLASSNASFCVYHPNVELLIEAQFMLQQRFDVVLCSVTGGWCREYQVLPDRTHPTMMMDSSNGALLTFYLAKSSVGKPFRAMTLEEQTASTKVALKLQQRVSASAASSKREGEGAAKRSRDN